MSHIKVVGKIRTHILCLVTPSPENRAVYEIMWENVDPDRPQLTIWRMRIRCWITKATDTHSEYVTLIPFHCNSGNANAPQCYVKRALPVLLIVCVSNSKRADERSSAKQATLTEGPAIVCDGTKRSCRNTNCCSPLSDGVASRSSRFRQDVVCE